MAYPRTLTALLLALAATGCVSQRHADDLQTRWRMSNEQLIELRVQLEEKQALVDAMQDQAHAQDAGLADRARNAEAERDRLAAALDEAEKQLRSIGTGPILEAELDLALNKLAATNPGLMSYDPALGMVKFSSDLTFDLGSTDLSTAAAASLAKFARILQSPNANGYTACIVGHTDNVPIKKPDTRAKHPTNWHLSVHRAIAVKDALVDAGVPADRLGVAGYGPERPIAANARKGSQANRRVEIYLIRSDHAGVIGRAQPGNYTDLLAADTLAEPDPIPEPTPPAIKPAPAPPKPMTPITAKPEPKPEPETPTKTPDPGPGIDMFK